jgi:hypothetical protein
MTQREGWIRIEFEGHLRKITFFFIPILSYSKSPRAEEDEMLQTRKKEMIEKNQLHKERFQQYRDKDDNPI